MSPNIVNGHLRLRGSRHILLGQIYPNVLRGQCNIVCPLPYFVIRYQTETINVGLTFAVSGACAFHAKN